MIYHQILPGPEVIKLFSCSTLLSMKFYTAHKCCWHYNIYLQDKWLALIDLDLKIEQILAILIFMSS